MIPRIRGNDCLLNPLYFLFRQLPHVNSGLVIGTEPNSIRTFEGDHQYIVFNVLLFFVLLMLKIEGVCGGKTLDIQLVLTVLNAESPVLVQLAVSISFDCRAATPIKFKLLCEIMFVWFSARCDRACII